MKYIDNPPVDYHKGSVKRVKCYKTFNRNGQVWVNIFHHNSTFGQFSSRESANESYDPNKFSVLKFIDEKFYINENNENFYQFLIEYPTVPQYCEWRQKTLFTTQVILPSNPWIERVGKWDRFGGLRYHLDSTVLKGDIGDHSWNYAVGVISTGYGNWIPLYPTTDVHGVQYVDLWIRLKDISFIRFLPGICLPSNNMRSTCLGSGLLCAAAAVLIDADIPS